MSRGPLTNLPGEAHHIFAPWIGQRSATFRFELVNGTTGQFLGEITPIRDASLSHDTTRTIKRALRINLGRSDTAAIDPVVDRVDVYMVFNQDEPHEHPLGRYMFADAQLAQYTSGDLGGYALVDEMFIVDQQITAGVTGDGRPVQTLIREVLGSVGAPVPYMLEASPYASVESWGIGTGRGQVLESLALSGDYFCLAPETLVLCSDLTWQRLDQLSIGQEIVGFDEKVAGPYQRYRRATVNSLTTKRLPSYEIETDYGTTVASADHLWLVKLPCRTEGLRRQWKRTSELTLGDRIVSFGKPWQSDDARDAGYLAGVYDGEGFLSIPSPKEGAYRSKVPRIGFGQNPGIVLDKVRGLLTERGFSFREARNPKSQVINLIHYGGKYESMRFLGSVRPGRLLQKASLFWEDRATWSVAGNHKNDVAITGLRCLGPTKVIAIGTSTQTLIANGLLSHNSPWFGNDRHLHFIRSFDPARRVPDFDFDNAGNVSRDGVIKTNDLLTAPNRFVVVSNTATDPSLPVFGTAEVAATAPHSIANRGFTIPLVVNLQVADNLQAAAVARNLAIRQDVFERVTLATAPDPRHDSYNVILWQGQLWLELSWSMPLLEGAAMTHTLRRAYT